MSGSEALERLERMEEHYRSALARVEAAEAGLKAIEDFFEAMRPLIVTSQYDLATLEKRISRRGERESARAIVSRLRQMCHEVHLTGGDRRRGRNV